MAARSASSSITVAGVCGARPSPPRSTITMETPAASSMPSSRARGREARGGRTPPLPSARRARPRSDRAARRRCRPTRTSGAGASRTQVMCQPVRTRVQFGIGQPFVAGDQGQSVGRCADLSLEHAVDRGGLRPISDTRTFRAVRRGLTPRHDLPALRVGEQRQLGQPPFWISDEVLERLSRNGRENLLDRRGLEQVCVELHRAREPCGRILESQREIELRRTGPLVEIEWSEGQVERADRRQRRCSGGQTSPGRAESGWHRAGGRCAAMRTSSGTVLVFERLEGDLAHAGQEFPHRRISG